MELVGASRSESENPKGGQRKMQEAVQVVIDKIRPTLQADGGDVELVSVDNGVVKVRLQGACKGCPMSQMTLKNGIEKFIKKEVPEVDRVEAVD
jgi:Fe-S cluster biogenesis protein NfuA